MVPEVELGACVGLRLQHTLGIGVQVQRCQQDELQRTGLIAHRVGDLQHRLARQPAHRRLHHHTACRLGLLEVLAILQLQLAPRAQGVAVQGAVGPDGQKAGVLGVFFEYFGQEARTGGLVLAAQQGHPSQAEEQLAGAGDLAVQVIGDIAGPCTELFAGQFQRGGALLEQQPHHQQQRQQRDHQHR